MKKVLGWKKIEIVCVIIVVAFMSFLIGIYYQSRIISFFIKFTSI